MHKHYEPIQEKQALVYSYLEEADRLLLCFIKENITSEFDTGDELTNTAVDYEKELKTLITKASLVNLSVDCFYGFHDLSQSRKNLVLTAMSLEGKITYEWGAKAKNAGWNTRWDTKGNGLDCSGFIEWVYWTVTGSPNEQLRSTLMITYSQEEITHNELQPGDLGTKLDGGTYYLDYQGNKYYSKGKALKANEKAGYTEEDITTVYNHVGIYVGKDIYGNDLWCHCAGGEIRTVTIGTFEEFTHYYRMQGF